MTHRPKRKRKAARWGDGRDSGGGVSARDPPPEAAADPVEQIDLTPVGLIQCHGCGGTGRAANAFYTPQPDPTAFPFTALNWPSHQACASCGGTGWQFHPDYHPPVA